MAEREALATRGVGSTVDLAGTSGGRELSRGLVGVRVVARELNHPSAAGWNHYMRTETRRDITIYKKCIFRHLDALFAMGKECHANCYFAMSKGAMQNVLGRKPHETCWAEVPHEAQRAKSAARSLAYRIEDAYGECIWTAAMLTYAPRLSGILLQSW